MMTLNNIAELIREEIGCIVADSAVKEENIINGEISWDYVSADVHIDLFESIDKFVPAELKDEAKKIANEMTNIWFESAVDDYLEMLEA